MPTPLDLLNTTAKFTQTALDLWVRHVTREPGESGDPLRIGEVHAAMARGLMGDPIAHVTTIVRTQADMWADYMALSARLFHGADRVSVVEPAADDRRFRDEGWSNTSLFELIKQSYLIVRDFRLFRNNGLPTIPVDVGNTIAPLPGY